jgi:hypothetical protein
MGIKKMTEEEKRAHQLAYRLEWQKKWRAEHPDYAKQQYAKNREKESARKKAARLKDPEATKKRDKAQSEKNAEYRKQYREKNRELLAEKERKRQGKIRERNKEEKEAIREEKRKNREEEKRAKAPKRKERKREYDKIYRAERSEELKKEKREYSLKKRYKLSPEKYQELLSSFNGRCPVCSVEFSKDRKSSRYPHVDHCHSTGVVRGILCTSCNAAEGLLDTIENAKRLLAYMERFELMYAPKNKPLTEEAA